MIEKFPTLSTILWMVLLGVHLVHAAPARTSLPSFSINTSIQGLTTGPVHNQNVDLRTRNAQLGAVLGGLGSGIGSVVSGLGSGLGSVVGGVGSALGSATNALGGAVGNVLGGLTGTNGEKKPEPKQPQPPKPAPQPVYTPRPQPRPATTVVVPWPIPRPTWEAGDNEDQGQGGDRFNGGGSGGGQQGGGRNGNDAGGRRKLSSLSVSLKGPSEVICRNYPDTISTDTSKLEIYRAGTKLDVTCYTVSEMKGVSGNIKGDTTWLKTSKNCYINGQEVQSKENFQETLNYCSPPRHWVGTLMSQYTRVDCYDCASLDCPSRNVGMPPYVDLDCTGVGQSVKGNNTWIRSSVQSCYFPGSVFNPYGWLGTPGGYCQ